MHLTRHMFRPIAVARFLICPALVACLAAAPAGAQEYPSRPVKIVVPFGAGGPTDVFTRAIGDELKKALNQPFVMENRPGAGSVIGSEAVAKSAADGYTLLMISATQATNETLISRKNYKLAEDFVAVAPLMRSDLVLVVHPSVPAKTTAELIALAKAKPGMLNYASSGQGSNYHMAAELFKSLAKVDIVHVPYKGSTGARQDILSGQVQMMFDSVPTMAPLIASGHVRALATTGLKRSPTLPDIPTLSEAGVTGYEASLWTGLVAPAGTSPEVVSLLNKTINAALIRPDLAANWIKQGATPLPMTPTEFKHHIDAEIVKWANVIRANNIKPF